MAGLKGQISAPGTRFFYCMTHKGAATGAGCGRPLTTPVAYLTSPPMDPFSTHYHLQKMLQNWGFMIKEASVMYAQTPHNGKYGQPLNLDVPDTKKRYKDVGYF